jgi:YggT family protein
VESIVLVLGLAVTLTRFAAFALVVAGGAACAISWGVRTRRLNPFGPWARFARDVVDPRLAPVERAVRRAGGTPASVPWWGLAALVVIAIVVIQLVQYLAGTVYQVAAVAQGGSGVGILRLLAQLTFTVLELAIFVRVLSSWVPSIQGSRWLRWSYTLSEPLLAPLRHVLPTIGPIDLSPLVALLLLQFVGGFVVNGLR